MNHGHQTHIAIRSLITEIVKEDFLQSIENDWASIQKMLEKEEFNFLMKHLNGFVMIFNYKTNHYEYVSESLYSNLGHPPILFMGEEGAKMVYEHLHPEQAAFLIHPILNNVLDYLAKHATFETGRDYRYSCNMKLRNSNGEYLWHILDTLILQTDEKGFPHRTMVTCTNIQQYKKDEIISYNILKKDHQGIYRVVFENQVQGFTSGSLTSREREILIHIVEGNTN